MNATDYTAAWTEKIGRDSPSNGARHWMHEYATLVKLRITAMVVLTAVCGAYLATDPASSEDLTWSIGAALLGIGMVAAGTATANQIVERHTDAKMKRTSQRPLVTGTISVSRATIVTIALIVGGALLAGCATNWLTAVLTVSTSVSYIAVYTPLKRVTPLCTAIGAVPGAMPILLGWVAVRGEIDWQAALLFTILFFWQFPHFHAISLMYADDYRRGGIRMLPVVEPDGVSTRRRIAAYSVALVAVTLIPTFLQMTGLGFNIVALALGGIVVVQGFRMFPKSATSKQPLRLQARRMVLATVIYLPLLLIAMMIDHRF